MFTLLQDNKNSLIICNLNILPKQEHGHTITMQNGVLRLPYLNIVLSITGRNQNALQIHLGKTTRHD